MKEPQTFTKVIYEGEEGSMEGTVKNQQTDVFEYASLCRSDFGTM